MISQPNYEIANQASLLHIPDGSENKVWSGAEYEAVIVSNETRCPKQIGKERKVRRRAAIAMLEKIGGIRDELGKIHIFLLNQAG